jgi:hypothetical protein
MDIVYGPVKLGSNFIIRFRGEPGEWYTVEASPRIILPAWDAMTNVMAPVGDDGFGSNVFQYAEPAGLMTTRFYRLLGPP